MAIRVPLPLPLRAQPVPYENFGHEDCRILRVAICAASRAERVASCAQREQSVVRQPVFQPDVYLCGSTCMSLLVPVKIITQQQL